MEIEERIRLLRELGSQMPFYKGFTDSCIHILELDNDSIVRQGLQDKHDGVINFTNLIRGCMDGERFHSGVLGIISAYRLHLKL